MSFSSVLAEVVELGGGLLRSRVWLCDTHALVALFSVGTDLGS